MEALARFKQSNYLDCRINAYSYSYSVGADRLVNNAPINFLFIDLDRSDLGLVKALESTLQNILQRLNGYPTVLWTGNGYHIYQPLQDFYFSDISHFNKFDSLSVNKKFLRYAAAFLSNNNSDKNNYQSAKSCMLRIPGTFNSKCPQNNGQVKIIQKWNGIRANVTGLLANFYAYLTDEKIKQDSYKQKSISIIGSSETNSIAWIDLLLKTPIADYRKNAISLILAPYLITIKQLQPVEATNQIRDWLEECSKLRRLDFNANYRISAAIKDIQRQHNGIRPMRLDTLKARNPELYDLLVSQ